MKTMQGVGASPGLAIGPAFLFQKEDLSFKSHPVSDPPAEWVRMELALKTASDQLNAIYEKALAETGQAQAEIFEAHQQMLSDPELVESIRTAILEKKSDAETALTVTTEGYACTLEALHDEYFSARAADVRDVSRRALRILLGRQEVDVTMRQPSLVIAADLTPSDTIRLDKSKLLGFCTAEGGATSHTAILAKALGLPAVVGAGEQVLGIQAGELLILNGSSGTILLNPDEETLTASRQAQNLEKDRAAIELEQAQHSVVTRDGHTVEVVANVGSVSDAQQAIAKGAEGIGLLRTEFLYLDRQTAPNEDEQYAAYKAIFDVMGERPVVIRTIDVGGDKELPYIDLGHEDNPFLGWRAIRMCLDNPDFFKTQLRAILRASVGHDIRIMFPMIAAVSEVRKARLMLDEARADLDKTGTPYGQKIQTGIMIEIPAAAVMADKFIGVVDFFSIGTNDLTQYTLAVERTNKKVGHLSNALDPAVLRLIARVIEEGHKGGVWVGMCGELAGDPRALPVLLGLGLDEFSMAPSMIPHAKAVIRVNDIASCQRLAADVLDLATFADVEACLTARLK